MYSSASFHKKKWFTIVEIVICVLILWIVFVWILRAFKETFSVLSYINESMAWTYFLRNGVEDIVSVRNDFVNEYWENWWDEFVKKYWSWTFVLNATSGGLLSLSWIVDLPQNYEWPINKLWEKIKKKEWVYFFRKVTISHDPLSFYLENITRNSTWDLILNFSKDIYNEPNFFISSPLENENWGKIELDSQLSWNFYDIDWISSSNPSSLSNINKNLKYSKIFDYQSWDASDWKQFIVHKNKDLSPINQSWNEFIFEFDTNGSISSWSTAINIWSWATKDSLFYKLCQQIDRLDFVDCRINKMLYENIYTKIVWINKEFSDINFWSWFVFSFSWTKQLNINLWSWNNIFDYNTTQYLNPSYLLRSINNSNKFALKDDKSDVTSWKWVKIPSKPSSGDNSEFWQPSILNIKIDIFLYDWDKFVEENSINFKVWDIYRDNFNTNKNLWN